MGNFLQYPPFQVVSGGGGSSTGTTSLIVGTNSVSAMKVVYMSATGVQHAGYSSESTTKAIGISLENGNLGDTVIVQTSGKIADFSTGMTVGNPVFLGANGAVISDPSTIAIGSYRVMIGYALSATDLMVSISEPSRVISSDLQKVGLGRTSVFTGPLGNLPANLLPLDGSAISRVYYADLFALYGTGFGAGDGSSTFNLPNWTSLNIKDSYDVTQGFWVVQAFADTVILNNTNLTGSVSGFNYVLNPEAVISTAGYATYADVAGTSPVDGTGGSPTISFGLDTTKALFGTNSFLITHNNGATNQGEGVSYDMSFDTGVVSQEMQISFFYKTSANYTDGVVSVFLYDKTNSNFIPLSFSSVPASTNSSKFYASFFPSSSTSYRLIWHVATSTVTTAWTMNIDKVFVGIKEYLNGSAVGAWQTFTPTFPGVTVGTGGYQTGRWRRVGSNMEMEVTMGIGTGWTITNLNFNLPSGYTMDSHDANWFQTGITYANTNASIQYIGSAMGLKGSTTFAVDSGNGGGSWTGTVPFTWASGYRFNAMVSVPIAQWTTNVNLATDFTEFASNDMSGGTAAGTTYTTGAVYGSGGSNFVAVNSATITGNSTTKYRVTFQRPIQPTDILIAEAKSTTGEWYTPDFGKIMYQGGAMYGFEVSKDASDPTGKSALLYLGNAGLYPTGATYASASASPWSVVTSWKWRVRKISNGNMAEQSPTSSSAIAGTNVLRDPVTGRAQIVDPVNALDITNKGYVDNQGGTISSFIVGSTVDIATTFGKLFSDGAVTVPTSGYTSAVDAPGTLGRLTASFNSTNPLSGTRDLKIAKGGVLSAQGQGWSVDFQTSPAYLGIPWQIQFPYYMDNISLDNNWQVFLFATSGIGGSVIGSTIPLSDQYLHPTTGTTPNQFFATLYPTTSLYYRLVIMYTGMDVITCNLNIDNITVSKQNTINASAIGGWTQFTPSWVNITLGSSYSSEGRWRRVGNEMEVEAWFFLGTGGALTASTLKLNIPSPYTVDLNSLDRPLGYARVGTGSVYDLSTTTTFNLTVIQDNTNNAVYFTAHGSSSTVLATSPMTWTAGDEFYASFKVPISQWTTNIALAGDFTEYAFNTSGNVSSDTTNFGYGPEGIVIPAFTGITGVNAYTKDVKFKRDISPTDKIFVEISNTSGTGSWTDGGRVANTIPATVYGGTAWYQISKDTIRVLFYSVPSPDSGASWTAVNSGNQKWRVRKVSNGNLAEQPPVVFVEVYRNTALNINGANVDVVFDTKTEDTHSGYSTTTGEFTCPIPGKYLVESTIRSNSATYATVNYLTGDIEVNTGAGYTKVASLPAMYGNGGSCRLSCQRVKIVKLKAGDKVKITLSSGQATDITYGASTCSLSLTRIGS